MRQACGVRGPGLDFDARSQDPTLMKGFAEEHSKLMQSLAPFETRKDLSLNAEAREEAVVQLLELQAQIEAHLKAMKYGCPLDDSKDE